MDDAEGRGSGSPAVEVQLEELEKVLEQLEDESTPLETSFSLYEKGMALVKEINARIDRVEKQMIILEGQEDE
ncbi:MAG: exodeoxyribonuclease VII small subunit [Stomatobaculum sp.]|nr:exodeoxyribonuclease VII small subunit [Stomatobaculum sp.]